VINLCFHGVGAPGRPLEPDEGRYWIDEPFFHAVLDEVRDRTDVSISFDDSNASDLAIGLPALRRRGLRATFFVLAGRLGQSGSLDEADVRALRDEGMTIGTHGMDHVGWRGLTPDQRRREWVEARSVLEQAVGQPVTQAAAPLGRYDRSVVRSLRHLGYARVFTSDRRPALPGAWLVPRFSVTAEDDVETVRATMLTPPGLRARALLEAKAVVKRVR